MFDKVALLQILIDEMALELKCHALERTRGVGGARWKTPALEAQYALQMLNINRSVEVVGLLNMVVKVKSRLLRYHAQWSVGGAAKRTSSTSQDCGTSMSEHQIYLF